MKIYKTKEKLARAILKHGRLYDSEGNYVEAFFLRGSIHFHYHRPRMVDPFDFDLGVAVEWGRTAGC